MNPSYDDLILQVAELERRNRELEIFAAGFYNGLESFALCDHESRFIAVNDPQCQIVGYSREELLQMSCFDLQPVYLHAQFREFLIQLKDGGRLAFETVYRHKAGFCLPIGIQADAVKSSLDLVFLVLARDITDRKQQTETLERFDKVFSLTRDIIAYVAADYTCRMVNRRFCEVYGTKFEEAIGRTVAEGLGDDYFTKIVKLHLDRCLNGETTKYYSWFEYKTIGLRYREVTHYPDQDDEGRTKGAFVVIHDLTGLKEMEIALQYQNEQLLTLINSLPDFINFKDDKGNWLLANERMLRLFELGHIEYTGKGDAELAESSTLYQRVVRRFVETDEVAWANKRITKFIEQIEWPDKVKCTFEILKVPLFHDDGARKRLVVIGRDISGLLNAAKELGEKNRRIQETNIALKVLLDQQEDKCHVQELQIQATLKRLIFPYIENLAHIEMEEKGREYVQLISDHLHSLVDSFCRRLDDPAIGLSPKEMLVADLIRKGKSSQTVARLLGLTERTVEVYRTAIRKKLKISGKKINLEMFLKERFSV